jgi:hypothetical protein
MFSYLKRNPKRTPDEKEARIHQLCRVYVPPQLEADTLQGELLRCIGNLSDEAKRNENMNWDDADGFADIRASRVHSHHSARREFGLART